MPVEEVTLTARFKVDLTDVDDDVIIKIRRLFTIYKKVVNSLINYANEHQITNFKWLCHVKYHEIRKKYPMLPTKYIICACRHAINIYRTFIKLKGMGLCKKKKPMFKGQAIWLHKKLFKLNTEDWSVSIAVCDREWVTLRLLHGRYHDRFKGMKMAEAQLLWKDDDNLYLNIFFHQTVMLAEISMKTKIIAIDVNENVIAYGNEDFVERFETNEGIIRTRYFLKRRRIQLKIRGGELRKKLLEKYKGREWRRIREIYYKAAKEIVNKAKEVGATIIVMEDLKIYKENLGSKELNGRIHRWSYRRFQRILEYQAKLHGLNLKYVNPKSTSKTCPVCGGELDLSPNGHRLMRCLRCGLEEDRDVIAVKNLAKRYYEECASAKASQNLSF